MINRAAANGGFTLIEMLIAIAIAALLLAIAVPSFSNSQLSSQLRASTNDLVGSINLARSEAIKSGTTVTLCASSDGENCGGGWNQGWIIVRDGQPEPIRRQNSAPAGFLIMEASATAALIFQSTGVDSTPATFTICRSSPSVGHQERVIAVDATGRASVRRTANEACS